MFTGTPGSPTSASAGGPSGSAADGRPTGAARPIPPSRPVGTPGGTPATGGRATGQRPQSPPTPPAPGVRDQFGRVRSALGGLVSAHIELAKTEMAGIGKQIAIIAAMGLALLVLGLLLLTLVYIGTWLFLGEWLFGSMGWGLLHGTLFTISLMLPFMLNLAGAQVRAWGIAFLLALVITVLLSLLFASNIIRNAALGVADALGLGLAIDAGLVVGLVVGAVLFGILLLVVGLRARAALPLFVLGVVLGAIVGGIFGFVTFDLDGAIATAITFGLVSWLALTGMLAARRGIHPEKRYAVLQPRQTVAAINETRDWLGKEWQRQRSKLKSR